MILKEFEGLPGWRDGFAARNSKTIIAHPYYLSIVTCKWFGLCGIAWIVRREEELEFGKEVSLEVA
jgi:hypothetical protein